MDNRRLLLALAGIAVLASACTKADIQANEDKARAVFTAVKNGARVAASVVREGIDSVCANTPALVSGAQIVRTGLQQQSGVNTTRNLDNLDRSITTLTSVCTRASANPNDPDIKVLLVAAWTAYQSAKAAQNKAIAAGG